MLADYLRLFDGEEQGSGTAISPVFRTDDSLETQPTLRVIGNLDGGALKIQTLDPTVALADASDSDWVNTDDTIAVPYYGLLPFQKLNMRLKATSLGASANFTVDLIYNRK